MDQPSLYRGGELVFPYLWVECFQVRCDEGRGRVPTRGREGTDFAGVPSVGISSEYRE